MPTAMGSREGRGEMREQAGGSCFYGRKDHSELLISCGNRTYHRSGTTTTNISGSAFISRSSFGPPPQCKVQSSALPSWLLAAWPFSVLSQDPTLSNSPMPNRTKSSTPFRTTLSCPGVPDKTFQRRDGMTCCSGEIMAIRCGVLQHLLLPLLRIELSAVA